jgi:hypothetical protein
MELRHALLVLREEFANQLAFILVFNASKKFCSQRLDSFRSIKGHALIYLAATEVTRLASSCKYGPDLGSEVDFRE